MDLHIEKKSGRTTVASESATVNLWEDGSVSASVTMPDGTTVVLHADPVAGTWNATRFFDGEGETMARGDHSDDCKTTLSALNSDGRLVVVR